MTSADIQIAAAARWRPLARSWQRRTAAAPPVAVWLPVLLIAIAMALPPAYLLLRSADAGAEAWRLLLRPRTAEIALRSLTLAATVTLASVALAVPLAWLTVRTDLPYRRVWGVLTALPLVIPSYVGGFLIISALGPRGLLQGALEGPFGIERLPSIYGFPGAALTLVLLSYPYVLLTLRGVMGNLNPAYEETARSLGLGPWAVMRRVTLPQLRPALVSGGLLVALYTLADFGAVSLLRFETFTWAIYQQYQAAFDRNAAALLSMALVLVATIILIGEASTRGRMAYHESTGARRRLRPVRLGRWKWPALLFTGAVVAAALVLPASVLVYWLAKGLHAGVDLGTVWMAALSSVSVSALAAAATAACSVPLAVLVVRHPGLFAKVAERMSYVGYALPGVVVALALVFFGAHYARPLYQTIWLLLLAYVVLFLPAALGASRASLLRVGPRLEDAARSLGHGPLRTLRHVTAPLMLPGVLSGAALVFLLTMKELPATLILGPLGFRTLATQVWSASSEAFFAQAAVPALLLIVLSMLPLGFLILRDRARL